MSEVLLSTYRLRKTILDTLNEQRSLGKFCDVIFVVGSRRVQAHRNVLSAACPYFEAMFESGMRESREDVTRIEDVDADAFQSIVNYFYTSELALNVDNVENILRAASLLQVLEVIQWCCVFVRNNIDATSSVGIVIMSYSLSLTDLYNFAKEFIVEYFADVGSSEDFMLLPQHCLLNILNHDDFYVASEKDLFQALMTWFRHDTPTRKHRLSNFLGYVRWPLLGLQFLLETVGQDSLIREDKKCRALVSETKNYLEDVQKRAFTDETILISSWRREQLYVSNCAPDLGPIAFRCLDSERSPQVRQRRRSFFFGHANPITCVGRQAYFVDSGAMVACDLDTGTVRRCSLPEIASPSTWLLEHGGRLHAVVPTLEMQHDSLHWASYDEANDSWDWITLTTPTLRKDNSFVFAIVGGQVVHMFCQHRVYHYDLVTWQMTYTDSDMDEESRIGSAYAQGFVYAAHINWDEDYSYAEGCDYDDCQPHFQPCLITCFKLGGNKWRTLGKMDGILNLFACNEKLYAMCKADDETCTIYTYHPYRNTWTEVQDFRFNYEDVDAVIAIPAPATPDTADSFGVDVCHLRRRPAKRSTVWVPC